MEGTSSWKPNDWRTQHEPDLRKKVILAIVEKLKKYYPRDANAIKTTAITFEDKIYGIAKDKGDYLRRIHEKILIFDRKYKTASTANVANTPDPAQGKSLPTSLTYTQSPTNKQWLPQNNNIQSNLNIPDSSGLPTQVPMTVSAAQNLNIQMGEGVHSNLLPGTQRQQQIQGRQQLLPQTPHNLQQQSLLKQPIQQHQPIRQSFPQSSALSSLPSSTAQQNSQFLPRHHQLPSQRVHSSHKEQTLISQLMNGQDTHQNHLTSPQNKGEKQLTSQQNNMASFNVHGSSLHQSQNLADQQKQPYQFQTAQPANPSNKTVNTSGGDWREETYQKIKSLREKYKLVLTTLFQQLSDRLQAIDSLPQQKVMPPHERVKRLRAGKAALEQVLVFLNVSSRSSVSEMHRDRFSLYEAHVLKFTKHHMAQQQQQQQVHLPPDSDQVNSRLMASRQQNGASSSQREMPHSLQTRPKMEPKDDNNIMPSSGDVMVHSLEQNPQLLQREQRQLPKPVSSPVAARMSDLSPVAASSPRMQVEKQPLATPLNKTESQGDPLVTPPPEPPIAERPIDRLIKAIQSSSPESLAQSVSEMSSIISLTDMIAGPDHGYRARLGEDLSEKTRLRVEQVDTNPTKRFKRSFTTIPPDITSQTDSYKRLSPSYALQQEITEINRRLVETVVKICNEEEDVCPSEEVTSGLTVVVTCSYVPVALSATFKALYNSGHITQIQPLRLLVPKAYPYSPIILDKVLFDTPASVHEYEDLSGRARSRFSLSMRKYSETMSLKEIAQAWDECARATMLEYAERHGGGTFSSKYGSWESVVLRPS